MIDIIEVFNYMEEQILKEFIVPLIWLRLKDIAVVWSPYTKKKIYKEIR